MKKELKHRIVAVIGVFVAIQVSIAYAKEMVITTINQHAAAAQMAIDTGFLFESSIQTLETAYRFLSILLSVACSIVVFNIIRKDDFI